MQLVITYEQQEDARASEAVTSSGFLEPYYSRLVKMLWNTGSSWTMAERHSGQLDMNLTPYFTGVACVLQGPHADYDAVRRVQTKL
jgi:hypothetical protein